MPRTIAAAIAALLTLSASPALAAEFVIKDGRTSPENLTVNPAGDVITGSFSTPLINILKKGSTTAETFIDPSRPARSSRSRCPPCAPS